VAEKKHFTIKKIKYTGSNKDINSETSDIGLFVKINKQIKQEYGKRFQLFDVMRRS